MLKATAQIAERPQPDTKGKILEAAFETIREEGFAGASARSIARRGGFNQALVFYHFGTVTNLLLATLDLSSERRMAAYRAALEETDGPEALLEVALRLYREDLASGHITVLAELIAGSLSVPGLKAEIAARVSPWTEFAEGAIARSLDGSPFGGLLPARDLAYAVVALYLGVEMMEHLSSDTTQIDGLATSARSLAALVAPLLSGR